MLERAPAKLSLLFLVTVLVSLLATCIDEPTEPYIPEGVIVISGDVTLPTPFAGVIVEEFAEIDLKGDTLAGRMAFGPDGYLYVGRTNYYSDGGGFEILRVTPSGVVLTFGGPITPDSINRSDSEAYAPDLAFDGSDLVISLGFGSTVVRMNTSRDVFAWLFEDTLALISGLSDPDPVGVTVVNGDTYVGLAGGQVLLDPSTTAEVSVFVSLNDSVPAGVGVDDNGNLIILDAWYGQIFRLPFLDPTDSLVIDYPAESGDSPWPDLVVDTLGVFCDADRGGYIVPNGTVLACADTLGVLDTLATGFGVAQGVALNDDGELFVSDIGQDAIFKLTSPNNYVVTNTNNSGSGSLRQAILDANSNPGPDSILFDIDAGSDTGCDSGTEVCTIQPASFLPTITGPVVIDGYSQPSAVANTVAAPGMASNADLKIELDGTNAGGGGNGLSFIAGGSGSTVRGLVINRFSNTGILMYQDVTDVVVEGNFIGTDVEASSALSGGPTMTRAVFIYESSSNTVGGTTPASRNVIYGQTSVSGSDGAIEIYGEDATYNVVQGNLIGTNAAGTAVLGDFPTGVRIHEGAHYNLVGGETAAERNVISGHDSRGVDIGDHTDLDTRGNQVTGNFIGTDGSGTSALGNGTGVFIQHSESDSVGGNVISASGGYGIEIRNSLYTMVDKNYIGTEADGISSLGNSSGGVLVLSAPHSMICCENIIAFNGGNGVEVLVDSIVPISRNSIFSNGGLGIDLGGDGVTANDAGDGDVGANALQNFPVLTSAISYGTETRITGTLNSIPGYTYYVSLYASDSADVSGYGEGQTHLRGVSVNTDGSGNGSFNVTLSYALPIGTFITATAENYYDNTSEFSAALAVSGGEVTVTVTYDGDPVEGRVVTAVNNSVGPFRADSTPTIALTDADGEATIGDLILPGDYCVHVRPLVRLEDATAFDEYVVPPGDSLPANPGEEAGAITGPDTAVYFSNQNYIDNCVDTPPISLSGAHSDTSFSLALKEGVDTLEVVFVGPSGDTLDLPAWAVIEKDSTEITWFPSGLDPDVVPGILVSAAPPGSPAWITGLPPEAVITIQSGIATYEEEGALTSTIIVTTPEAGEEPEPIVTLLEPQMCAVERKDEPEGDSEEGRIDFLGPIKDGFRADAELNMLPEIGVFYDQVGSGLALLHMQFRRRSGTPLILIARYECEGNTCEQGTQSGSAYDIGVRAAAFFAAQEDGRVRVTWSIDGLPAQLRRVGYKLTTARDVFPRRSYTDVAMPDVCTGGLSNDPRWWIAM